MYIICPRHLSFISKCRLCIFWDAAWNYYAAMYCGYELNCSDRWCFWLSIVVQLSFSDYCLPILISCVTDILNLSMYGCNVYMIDLFMLRFITTSWHHFGGTEQHLCCTIGNGFHCPQLVEDKFNIIHSHTT